MSVLTCYITNNPPSNYSVTDRSVAVIIYGSETWIKKKDLNKIQTPEMKFLIISGVIKGSHINNKDKVGNMGNLCADTTEGYTDLVEELFVEHVT